MTETASEPLSFIVEEAGCSSCATRVRTALEPLGTVEAIDLDHDANHATVQLAGEGVSEAAVNAALEQASEGSGHTYRVRPGSWSAAA